MKNKILPCIIGIITGIANGFLGSGGGTVVVPCLEKFMKTEPHKAHATAIAIILPLTVISAFLYYYKLHVDLKTLGTCFHWWHSRWINWSKELTMAIARISPEKRTGYRRFS